METIQAWRRGGDSNPRDPSESTRSPGVRLKPGSATSPQRQIWQYDIGPIILASAMDLLSSMRRKRLRCPIDCSGLAQTLLQLPLQCPLDLARRTVEREQVQQLDIFRQQRRDRVQHAEQQHADIILVQCGINP